MGGHMGLVERRRMQDSLNPGQTLFNMLPVGDGANPIGKI
jgi:hypothetical protein